MLYVLTSSTRGLLLLSYDKASASHAFEKAIRACKSREVIELADYECIGDDFQRIGILREFTRRIA